MKQARIEITESAIKNLDCFKVVRLPRKRKKELKKRWGELWNDFIQVKLK